MNRIAVHLEDEQLILDRSDARQRFQDDQQNPNCCANTICLASMALGLVWLLGGYFLDRDHWFGDQATSSCIILSCNGIFLLLTFSTVHLSLWNHLRQSADMMCLRRQSDLSASFLQIVDLPLHSTLWLMSNYLRQVRDPFHIIIGSICCVMFFQWIILLIAAIFPHLRSGARTVLICLAVTTFYSWVTLFPMLYSLVKRVDAQMRRCSHGQWHLLCVSLYRGMLLTFVGTLITECPVLYFCVSAHSFLLA
jgi:hypothetical protein